MSPRLALLWAAALVLSAFPASAQSASFSTTTYASDNLRFPNGGPNSELRVDLNGDGREDFISDNTASWTSGCTGSFAVALSTGDGAYASPVCYTLPAGVALYFATGDFFTALAPWTWPLRMSRAMSMSTRTERVAAR